MTLTTRYVALLCLALAVAIVLYASSADAAGLHTTHPNPAHLVTEGHKKHQSHGSKKCLDPKGKKILGCV